MGPYQSVIHWVTGTYFGLPRKGLKLTIHLCLVPRFVMRGVIPPVSISFHNAVLRQETAFCVGLYIFRLRELEY
jgi:hypothetical protein